jgi:hypothetical protein
VDDSDDTESASDKDDDEMFAFRRQLKVKVLAAGRRPGGILWYRQTVGMYV